jgi:hypothetical protein
VRVELIAKRSLGSLEPNDLWGELPECSGSARQLYSYLGCTMIKIKFVNSSPLNAS